MKEPLPAHAIDAALAHTELFPIREVARLTGVNPVTLRAWERRYGLILPTRTPSGHRLYSQADIDAIGSILGWLRRGVAVSKVGSILARSQALEQGSGAAGGVDDPARWQAQVREAVHGFDRAELERLFEQVLASHALEQVFDEVFLPVWQALGTDQAGFGQRSEWLFLDQFLRGQALLRLQRIREPKSWRVLVAPLAAEGAELELLVAGLLLGGDDLAVTVLAPTQPLDELALVCERQLPDALVLFANHRPAADLAKRLARLTLGVKCPVLVAGEAAEMAQDALDGGPVACLGAEAGMMRRRLRQYLAGQLDT
ncbi:MerR family transcriptional regulator [Pseudomonas entomophila]|uniref:MerR family transcriptional regulator n=1 Tax=Pseudomonas entomophila TaxID=312306 RepID=UPI0023D81C82|nr:MerR family transcriptional regulator [Pseudomonas entomophila]MDF0732796.1 MerR family transcriptional regulator [Pseudomonas entomophila]